MKLYLLFHITSCLKKDALYRLPSFANLAVTTQMKTGYDGGVIDDDCDDEGDDDDDGDGK